MASERTGVSWFTTMIHLLSGKLWELPWRIDTLSQPVFMSLTPEGLFGEVTPEVVYTSQVARALSTTAPYSAKWSAFQCRCMGRGRDCTSCHLPQVLIFLQLLMDRNLTLSTVKTYSAAFPSCYEGDGERFVFVLVKHFLNTNLSL